MIEWGGVGGLHLAAVHGLLIPVYGFSCGAQALGVGVSVVAALKFQ